jgi:hypothetical protein
LSTLARWFLFTAALTVLAAGVADAQDAPDHLALIVRMREAALTYGDRLQDFICTQITTRSADKSGSGRHWKRLEVQESELSYVAHREHYKVLKVNGQSEDPDAKIKKGYYSSSGEFGTALRRIFDPKVNAEFKWDHDVIEGGKRLCVFRYDVTRASSTYGVRAGADHLVLAHHGFAHADCESGAVVRIQMDTEPRSVIRSGHEVVLSVQLDVRYRPVLIGTREFLLPESAESIARYGTMLTKADIQFQSYRKFQADSKMIFNSDTEATETAPELPNK